jgi:hypothetical protein
MWLVEPKLEGLVNGADPVVGRKSSCLQDRPQGVRVRYNNEWNPPLEEWSSFNDGKALMAYNTAKLERKLMANIIDRKAKVDGTKRMAARSRRRNTP